MTRKEAIEIIEKSQYKKVGTVSESEIEEALNLAIKALEQESKCGEWIVKEGGLFESDIGICSICESYLDFSGVNEGFGDANFCPNCGAKMERG